VSLLRRYFAALKGALFAPDAFFADPPPPARAELRAVPFGLFTVTCGLALGLLLGHLLVPQIAYDQARAQAERLGDANPQLWPLLEQILAWLPADAAEVRRRLLRDLAFTPLFAAAAVYLSAWLTHAILLAMGQNKNGFRATLHAIAWGLAPFAVAAVPELGGLVASLWAIGLTSYAVSRLHGISTRNAFIAVIAPPLILLGAAAAAMVLYVIMLLRAGGGATRS
jgi:hypothetical protein